MRRASLCAAALSFAVATLAACTPNATNTVAAGSAPSLFAGVSGADLGARYNANPDAYGTVTRSASAAGQLYTGSLADPSLRREAPAGSDRAEPGSGAVREGDGYRLSFENADIAAVAKTVLGEILEQTYTIDPRVTGQINLASGRPIPKARLLRTLETALKPVNVVIVREGEMLRLAPISENGGSGAIEEGTVTVGYGTSVITLKYISAQNAVQMLENFAARAGTVRVEPGTNQIIVQGTAEERQAALDSMRIIDTDLMKSRSVGLFPLANASPETVIVELSKIVDAGEGGLGQNVVKFQPMTRMNAVLVIARRADVLEQVGRWVRRLDQTDAGAVGVKVFRLKYAQAKTVAAILNDNFAGRAASSGTQDQDALQPSSSGGGGFAQSPGTGGRSSSLGSNPAAPPGGPASATSTPFGSGSRMAGPSSPGGSPASDGLSAWAGLGGTGSGSTSGSLGTSGGQGPMAKVRVTPDVVNNTLLISSGPAEYKLIEAALVQLDRPPVQVAIEATIAEVALTDVLQYGVQAYLNSKDLGLAKSDQGAINLTSSAIDTAIKAAVPGSNFILGAAGSPRIVLNALHGVTSVKVLSSPSMVVLSNQPAVLQVGNQIAIKTQSTQSTETVLAPVVNSITYKDTGIILRVLPRVQANGVVSLDVEQEISNVVDNSGGTDGLTPTISQRRVKSSIAVSSGQTVLLAGMISEQVSQSRNGLPGFSTMRWLDEILSNNNNNATRTELIIFIKPKIMRDQLDAQDVAEEFRARMTAMVSGPRVPRRGVLGPTK